MKLYAACFVVALAGCERTAPVPEPAGGTGTPPAAAPRGDHADRDTPVVVTQADEDDVRELLEEFRSHTARPEILVSSQIGPYLDCPARHALVAYGWKAVPYLIEQVGRAQSVEDILGAAAINDPAVKTPQQVVAHNRERRAKVYDTILPGTVLVTVLRETPAVPDGVDKLATHSRGEPPGTRATDAFAWVEWWRTHKARFDFRTKRPAAIPDPENGVYHWPHMTTSARAGLLDIHAVSVTYRDIIERAAAELGLDVFIGKHAYLDLIATVRMKSVTFEEFLHLLSADIPATGLEYRKTPTGYHIGGEEPAAPRANIYGWGIMMHRTVFRTGDEIPVTVITRGTAPLVAPADPSFPGYGSFQVTRNDGSVVTDYRPVEAKQPTLPPVVRKEDCHPVQVSLSRFCTLPAGEYNLRFRYRDDETPTVAIKIYDRPAMR